MRERSMSNKHNEIISYIIRFLVGQHIPANILGSIGYTNKKEEFASFKIIIKPSGFFEETNYGTASTLPILPLNQWEGVPILFGNETIEMNGDTMIIHADIVAGTYFLISRYEEMVNHTVRDKHGRFPGKESLPYRAGFIDRPIIEEWGTLLRSKLREIGISAPDPEQKIKKIYLTHDVDQLAHFRNIRGMLGGLIRGIKRPKEGKLAIKSFFGSLIVDPWYTFPYLFKLDTELRQKLGNERCEIVTFLKSGGGKYKEDKPLTNLQHPDYKTLIRYIKRKNSSVGLHTSYEAGCNTDLITEEKDKLKKHTGLEITYNRNHFLNNREPEDFMQLIENGITDDFSMGYADMAGFRLGTCHAVKWINPVKKELTPLTLHHLTIMDVSLSEKRYMFMNAFDALQYCKSLIQSVETYNGEISLLWHNNSVEKNVKFYHRQLYKDLLKFLQEK